MVLQHGRAGSANGAAVAKEIEIGQGTSREW
jgi:hypothetical protein